MKFKLLTLTIVGTLFMPAATVSAAGLPGWYAPLSGLPHQSTWRCILHAESRSTFIHPNLGDNNPNGSSGVFQIEQATWAAHQLAARVPARVHVWQASLYQQARVAAAIWRADGFSPWRSDGCVA